VGALVVQLGHELVGFGVEPFVTAWPKLAALAAARMMGGQQVCPGVATDLGLVALAFV
jgi:hypothetical protein